MNETVDAFDGIRTSDADESVEDGNVLSAAISPVDGKDDEDKGVTAVKGRKEDPSELDESVNGVPGSDDDEADICNAGTGVNSGNGERGVIADKLVGVSGIGSRTTDDKAEPVGLKNDVSNETSRPSGTASDAAEGEAFNCDDS